METQNTELTVGELVANDYRTADVFRKYGIDFCCGGKKPLSKVCVEKGIDFQSVENDLKEIEKIKTLPSQNFNNWDIDFLADYIINTHHAYINNNLEIISQYLEKVAKVHGHAYTETVKIFELWKQVVNDLKSHMMKEEKILFPYIKQMMKIKKENSNFSSPGFGTVQNPVRIMEHEHDVVGDLVKEIQRLSNNFNQHEEACNTYRVSYAKLNEFAQDLFTHIHLENNILFPKAIALEKILNKEIATAE